MQCIYIYIYIWIYVYMYIYILMYIYLLSTLQEAEIVGNSRQSSSMRNSLGSFLWRPIKAHPVWGFCPFPPYDNFKKPLPLGFSRSHKYNNYGKATCIVSSNLCLFTCPQAFHEIPTYRNKLVQKGCFSNSSSWFWC